MILLAALLGQQVYRRNDYFERVVVKIEVAHRCEREPLRIVEAAGGTKLQIGEGRLGEKVGYAFFLLSALDLAVVGDVLIDPKLFYYLDSESHLLLYLADGALPHVFPFFDLALGYRPMPEDVVDEREVRLPALTRVHDRAGEMFRRHLALRELVLARRALVLPRLTELDIDGAQNAAHKTAGGGGTGGCGQLDGFVDGDLGRHLRAVRKEKLGQAQPQDVAVDGGYLFERPLRRRAHDDFVYLLLLREGGLEELFHERHIGIARPEFFRILRKPRECLVGGEFFIRRVAFKEDLQNDGTGQVSIC